MSLSMSRHEGRMNPWIIRDPMAKAGYARAGSVGQSLDVRREKLSECDKLFEEKRSGSTDAPPMLRQCLDHLIVSRIDPLARSTPHPCRLPKPCVKRASIRLCWTRTSIPPMPQGGFCSTCWAPSASSKPKSAPNARWTGSRGQGSGRALWKTACSHG